MLRDVSHPDPQATLALDARLPAPPADLRPMLPRPAPRLPADGGRIIDPTWGGLRVLAAVRGSTVAIRVDGRDVGARFPDLVTSLADLSLADVVLDGEVVVPGARRRALIRALGHGGDAIRPATLVVSDLPWLHGRPLLAEALERRRARLTSLRLSATGIVVLEVASGPGAVDAAMALRGLAGVIAKRTDSPYLPGTRSRHWALVSAADLAASGGATADRLDPGVAGGEGARAPRPDLALLRTLPLGEDGPSPLRSAP